MIDVVKKGLNVSSSPGSKKKKKKEKNGCFIFVFGLSKVGVGL